MSIADVKEYRRYYGDFRGVDFSTDVTQVSDKRFCTAVNVYKDYQTSNGNGIETIPGFRKRFEAPNHSRVYGIHTLYRYDEGSETRKVLIHAGKNLYEFDFETYDEEIQTQSVSLFSSMAEADSKSFVFNNRLYIIDGKNYLVYDGTSVLNVKDNAYVPTTYINIIPNGENANIGVEYEQRNMLSAQFKHTFIITKYKDSTGAELISKIFFMNEPFTDIESVYLYGKKLEYLTDYRVNKSRGCITLTKDPKLPEETEMTDEKGNILDENGEIVYYPEMYAGLEITASRAIYKAKDVSVKKADGTVVNYTAYQGDDAYQVLGGKIYSIVEKATVVSVFDNRVFFSGFPGKPNLILYCARNSTGYSDPSYIGVLNYMEDGVGDSPVTAMIPIANALLVLKSNAEHESSVYYHTPTETGFDIIPKVYPSESGLAGTGCIGAAINFLDDPVFVSALGLEALGQLSVRYERAREHRSSLVDSVLVNSPYLSEAKLCEWCGYLLLLVGGSIFMADSRQKYQSISGDVEYEWYYLEDIGVYENQEKRYIFDQDYPIEFMDGDHRFRIDIEYNGVSYNLKTLSDFDEDQIPYIERVGILNDYTVTAGGKEYTIDVAICRYRDDTYAILCYTTGEMSGGDFKRATAIASFSYNKIANVYFGTENGVVCSFNFDKRQLDDGIIDSKWYTFNDRTIVSGVSMMMDNCGYPDLTKSTIKKSLVVKTRSMSRLSAKINVRTNKKSDSPVGSISSSYGIRGIFSNMDFSDFTFLINDMPMFSLNEKEKKWVEKQYSVYSDEYKKPFSLIYLGYRYRIAGKFKG